MGFDYSIDYSKVNLRRTPELYRVGKGEQGVLMVQPYKSEILPYWKFSTIEKAQVSSRKITSLFFRYRDAEDFVGMDMARKFLQMGFTRARRYANHPTGRKFDSKGELLPFIEDNIKAEAAEIFREAWFTVEQDPIYQDMKAYWRAAFD